MTPYDQSSINKLTSGFITKHIDCYFDDGFLYWGKLGVTRSGAICGPWSIRSGTNLVPLRQNGIGGHGFYRNPVRLVSTIFFNQGNY